MNEIFGQTTDNYFLRVETEIFFDNISNLKRNTERSNLIAKFENGDEFISNFYSLNNFTVVTNKITALNDTGDFLQNLKLKEETMDYKSEIKSKK